MTEDERNLDQEIENSLKISPSCSFGGKRGSTCLSPKSDDGIQEFKVQVKTKNHQFFPENSPVDGPFLCDE
jgi:hypothetical protein